MDAFSLTGYRILLVKEFREAWGTSRLPVTLIVFFILGLISPLVAYYTPDLLKNAGAGIQMSISTPTLQDAIAQFVKNVGGNGVFVAIVLAMGSVARERERGTAAFVLTKPVSRLAFLAAKFTALLVVLGLGMLVAGGSAYGYTVYFFGATSGLAFAEMVLLVWLALVAFMAVTFLASTLTASTVAAAALGFAAWLVLALLGISPNVLPNTPNGLSDPAQSLALGTPPAHLTQSIVATTVIIVVALLLAWFTFLHQEQTATPA